jgi:hypothetical protein
MAYVFQAFSHKTRVWLVGFLSPYVYFEGAGVINKGGYDLLNIVLFIIITGALLFIAQRIYVKKDVQIVG